MCADLHLLRQDFVLLQKVLAEFLQVLLYTLLPSLLFFCCEVNTVIVPYLIPELLVFLKSYLTGGLEFFIFLLPSALYFRLFVNVESCSLLEGLRCRHNAKVVTAMASIHDMLPDLFVFDLTKVNWLDYGHLDHGVVSGITVASPCVLLHHR